MMSAVRAAYNLADMFPKKSDISFFVSSWPLTGRAFSSVARDFQPIPVVFFLLVFFGTLMCFF